MSTAAGENGREELAPRSILTPPSRPFDTPVTRALNHFDHYLGVVETALLVGFMVLLVGVSSMQAISTKMFDKSYAWSFEIVRYMVFFIAMTGAALAAQQERQISMDFVTHNISPRMRARLRLALRLFTAAMCIILAKGALELQASVAQDVAKYHYIAAKNGIYALPIGAGLIAFHMVLHTVVDILYMVGGNEPPEPEHSAH